MREVSTVNPMANTDSNSLKPTVRALQQLCPSSQGAVIALVGQLAEGDWVADRLPLEAHVPKTRKRVGFPQRIRTPPALAIPEPPQTIHTGVYEPTETRHY